MALRVAGVRVVISSALAGLAFILAAQGRGADDGPPPYPGGPTSYQKVAVPDRFAHLMGVWEGPFRGYDLQAQAFRPYRDRLTFTADACIKVTAGDGTGDILLVGTMNDTYPEFQPPGGATLPAKSETGYLVYGLKGGDPNQVFVRTIEGGGTPLDYAPEYSLVAAQAFVYKAVIPGAGGQPQVTLRILDQQDSLASDDSRYFTLALTVGPDANPERQEIIAGGRQHHTPPGGTPLSATPRAPGKATSAPASTGVRGAMEALQKNDAARRGARALISTIPPG